MKLSIAASVLFAATTLAMAVPNEDEWEVLRAEDILNSNEFEIVDLEVTNEAFGDRIFRGTAASIAAEMEALKPGVLGENVELPSDGVSLNPLHKRQSINCDWGEHMRFNWFNCLEGISHLQNLGNSRCHVGRSRPNQPRTCSRVSCSHSCGMYLCNKMVSRDHWVFCGSIAGDISAIAGECADAAGGFEGAMDFDTHYIGLSAADC